MQLFGAVQRFAKIEQVCSSKDDVPPVYLMDEIADTCKEGAEASASVAEHVVRNLNHNNPIVKWKVRALIAACERLLMGDPRRPDSCAFITALQRHSLQFGFEAA
jgi:hypothetical protein